MSTKLKNRFKQYRSALLFFAAFLSTVTTGLSENLGGTISNSCDDMPLEGVIVQLTEYESLSDAEGFYQFVNIPPDTYQLTCNLEGFVGFEQIVTIEEGDDQLLDIPLTPLPEMLIFPLEIVVQSDFGGEYNEILHIVNLSECAADLNYLIDMDFQLDENLLLNNCRFAERIYNRGNRPAPLFPPRSSTDATAWQTIPTQPQRTELDFPYFLIFEDETPWGYASVPEILDELIIQYDIANSEDMGQLDLSEYSTIVFSSVQPQEFYDRFAENHDYFQNYVQDGGWIQFHGCTMDMEWEFWNGYYNLYEPHGTNYVVDEDHPIVTGVDEEIVGNQASHDLIGGRHFPHVNTIVDDPNGDRVLVEWEEGLGHVILTTQTWEIGYGLNWDTGTLLENAVMYSIENSERERWLRMFSDRGRVAPTDTSYHMILMHMNNHYEGVYEALLNIESNAEDQLTTVAVTFTLGHPGFLMGTVTDTETGEPIENVEIVVYDSEGEFYRNTFTDSDGLYSLSLNEAEYTVEAVSPLYLEIEPVEVNIVESEVSELNFEIESNNPPVLEVQPDQFTFIVQGRQDNDVFTIQNTGGQDVSVSFEIEYIEHGIQPWLELEYETTFIPAGEEIEVFVTTNVDLEEYIDWFLWEALILVVPDFPGMETESVWITAIHIGVYPWFAVEPTGLPYPIIINDATYRDRQLGDGDIIAVFDGELCVGYVDVPDENPFPLPLIAWEGNDDHDLPGFTYGNNMTFSLWSMEDMLQDLEADYILGDGTFGFAPYTEVILDDNWVEPPPVLDIPLQANYFELISTCIEPENQNAMDIFGAVESLVIAYQSDGGIVIPPFINTIGGIDITQGYKLFVSDESTISFTGTPVDPLTEFLLLENRWNWIGYPFIELQDITVGLAEIANDVSIVQNDDGDIWLPELGINTFPDQVPGEGYFVFPTTTRTFTYNWDDGILATIQENRYLNIPVVEDAPQPTGLPYAVIVSLRDDLQKLKPVFIELYDGNTLVGKGAILDDQPYTPVTAWQGDAEHNLEGFVSGHPMRYVVFAVDGTRIPVVQNNDNALEYGKGAYTLLNLDVAPLPTEFSVDQGYPNPFNPSVTIPFALPENGEVTFSIFNILGQQLYSLTNHYEAGYHRYLFDSNSSDNQFVSGMYFLKVQFENRSITQKIVLMR
ncbi:carboxypeptidase regulatory-like domain-containing protein [bacterium]|nr:carboxypeptidase regulatory-like domain-containing protein [bacterium]